MQTAQAHEFFRKLSVAIPKPKTELIYHNPFELLIAVILSAQATDVSVNKVTPALFERFPTPKEMARTTPETISKWIKTIGLSKSKAGYLVRTSTLLMEKHHGAVPSSRKKLEELPGVGRKTANVILNTIFGEPVIAVDTHVFRVSNRTGLAPGKTVLKVEKELERAIPEIWKIDAHHLLILHGRRTCKARKPNCALCPVSEECAYVQKHST